MRLKLNYLKYLVTFCISAGIFFTSVPKISAEYFKYKDKNGVVTYTDNPAEIPADQRREVQSFSDVRSESKDSKNAGPGVPPKSKFYSKSNTNTWDGKLRAQGTKLVQMRREMSKTRLYLEKENQELNAMLSVAKTRDQREQQLKKRMILNKKINAYHKKLEKYTRALDAYEKQLKED